MRRAVLTVIAAALVLVLPDAVLAHEIVVLPVGTGEIDAGLGDPARLFHATLDEPGDELVVTVRTTGSPLELVLLVPDRAPERGYGSGAKLPTIAVTPRGAAEIGNFGGGGEDEVVDEGTALGYRVVREANVAAREGTLVTVQIRRGIEPTRVALRVGAPTSFEAADVERTPRTLVRLRAWYDTPPPSATVDAARGSSPPSSLVAWYGAGVSLLGVLIAVWWVRSGRRRSRERGLERDS